MAASEYAHCYQWHSKPSDKLCAPPSGLRNKSRHTELTSSHFSSRQSSARAVDEWSICPNIKHKRHLYKPDHFDAGCRMVLAENGNSKASQDFVILGPGLKDRLALDAQTYPHKKPIATRQMEPMIVEESDDKEQVHHHKRHNKHRHSNRKHSKETKPAEVSPAEKDARKNRRRHKGTRDCFSEYQRSFLPPSPDVLNQSRSEVQRMGTGMLKSSRETQDDPQQTATVRRRLLSSAPKDHGVVPTSADERAEGHTLATGRTMTSEYADRFEKPFLEYKEVSQPKKKSEHVKPTQNGSGKEHSKKSNSKTFSKSTRHQTEDSKRKTYQGQSLEELIQRRSLAREYRDRSLTSHIWWTEAGLDEDDDSETLTSVSKETVSDALSTPKNGKRTRSEQSNNNAVKYEPEPHRKTYSSSKRHDDLSLELEREDPVVDDHRNSCSSSSYSLSSASSLAVTSSGSSSGGDRPAPPPRSQHMFPRSDMKWMHKGTNASATRHRMTQSQPSTRLGGFIPC